jgi:hypothetical protein
MKCFSCQASSLLFPQPARFKFFVWLVPYKDIEAEDRARAAVFVEEVRAARREANWFHWALHVRATNIGLQPVTIEYCGCDISSVSARNPTLFGADHSEVVTQESKCKLSTGDMHEWVIKFRIFPYRILRIYIFNSFGSVSCVDDRMVLDLHRSTVRRWPYSDGRLSLLPRYVSLLFLRWYRRRFRPTKVSTSEFPNEEPLP